MHATSVQIFLCGALAGYVPLIAVVIFLGSREQSKTARLARILTDADVKREAEWHAWRDAWMARMPATPSREGMMQTVESLIRELQKFPFDAHCHAYEGEPLKMANGDTVHAYIVVTESTITVLANGGKGRVELGCIPCPEERDR